MHVEIFELDLDTEHRLLDDSGEPTDQIEDKADYHLMDCERYLWSYLGQQRGTGQSIVIPPKDIFAEEVW